MADTVPSPLMNMPVPSVGVDPGPDWANNLNSCLSILDGHTHAPGSGNQIKPSGIDINTDFTMNSNNLTNARSLRFVSQPSPIALPTDLGCIYESGVDLYYNDGNGNPIRLTQSGSIVGTAGSITGLVPPASATYIAGNQTFVWQSAVNTPANMDFASAVFRNLVANSKGLTLQPPNAMGFDYTVTLPVLPSSQKIMTLDASGNMAAPYIVDNSTIQIISGTIQVPTGGITTTQIATGTVTVDNIFPYPKAAYFCTVNCHSDGLSPINFDQVIYDVGLNSPNASPSPPGTGTWRYTISVDGYYSIHGVVVILANATDPIQIAINDTVVYGLAGSVSSADGLGNYQISVFLNAGDYVDVRIRDSQTVVGSTLNNVPTTFYIEYIV